MANSRDKLASLERLANAPSATPGERAAARKAADLIRAKGVAGSSPRREPDVLDELEELLEQLRARARNRETHSNNDNPPHKPTHGPRCTGAPASPYSLGGCPDCRRILQWRQRHGWGH